MIQLTRLNNQPLVLNSDLIKFVEQAPDTVITLVTGALKNRGELKPLMKSARKTRVGIARTSSYAR